ncbi:MAG: polyketide antibiotic transporter [Nocardioides sp.]
MTGAGLFLLAYLRRDRWMLLWWILGGLGLYLATVYSVDQLYTTQAEYDAAAAGAEGNAALVAMAGPPRALDTLGGQTAWQTTAFGAIVAGLMSMFLIGRHTRAEEESGRDELLRAAAVGRYAPTTAAVLVAAIANLVLGIVVSVGLTAYGLAAADSFGLGLGLTACGWVFTGTALVACQLTSSTRSAYGIAGAVIGVAYVLRAIGDVGNGVLSWCSPIGWYQAMHQFSGLRWWPVLLMLAGAGATVWAAYALFARRDYGSGLLAARAGPGGSSRGLGGGAGLARRLHRGSVIGWASGLLLAGLAYGAIGDDVDSLLGDSDATQELFVQSGGDLVTGFYGTAILMLAVIASGFAISSALRPRAEEESTHLEVLMATALPRRRWLLGHVAMTVGGTACVLVASGVGLGLGYLLVTGDGATAWDLTWPVVQYAPAVLVLSGLTRLLFGVLPRWTVLAWAPLALVVVVMLFGDLFQLPQWLQDVSPFEHVPMVPAQDFSWPPLLALTGAAALLSVAGQVGFQRRDIH